MNRRLTFRFDKVFDMDDWIESVEGETVHITPPKSTDLGPLASRLVSSPTKYSVTYCEECDDFVLLIKDYPGDIGHCPVCERAPGILELGTQKKCYEM